MSQGIEILHQLMKQKDIEDTCCIGTLDGLYHFMLKNENVKEVLSAINNNKITKDDVIEFWNLLMVKHFKPGFTFFYRPAVVGLLIVLSETKANYAKELLNPLVAFVKSSSEFAMLNRIGELIEKESQNRSLMSEDDLDELIQAIEEEEHKKYVITDMVYNSKKSCSYVPDYYKTFDGSVVDLNDVAIYSYSDCYEGNIEDISDACYKEIGYAYLYMNYYHPPCFDPEKINSKHLGEDLWAGQRVHIDALCKEFSEIKPAWMENTEENKLRLKKFLYRFKDEIENMC